MKLIIKGEANREEYGIRNGVKTPTECHPIPNSDTEIVINLFKNILNTFEYPFQ